jgi:D-alanyl-D-alanine carboxypeptidase
MAVTLLEHHTRIAYYPDEGLSVAVVVNTNTPKVEAVQQAVARAALGMERLVPTDLPLTSEERAQYVGIYDLGPIQVRVFEDADRLILQPSGQTAARLLFQGEGIFLADVGRETRIEFRVEDGRATRLTLYQGSQQLDGRRTDG